MNILWIPQISCQSSAGEVLLEKDSNITFLKKLLNTELFTKNNVFICNIHCHSQYFLMFNDR